MGLGLGLALRLRSRTLTRTRTLTLTLISACAEPAKKKTLASGASGGEFSPMAGTLRCTTSCRLSSAALSARVSSSSPSSVGLLRPATSGGQAGVSGSGGERQRRVRRALRRATHVGPLRKGSARGGCRPARPSRVCWPSCARSRDRQAEAAPGAPCPPSSCPALSAGRQGSRWHPAGRQADCSPRLARTASGQCAGAASSRAAVWRRRDGERARGKPRNSFKHTEQRLSFRTHQSFTTNMHLRNLTPVLTTSC